MSCQKITLLLVMALAVANAARMQKAKSAARKALSNTKVIEGVPVYHFGYAVERSIDAAKASGLLEVGNDLDARSFPTEWILMLQPNTTQEELDNFCADTAATCVPEGSVGEAGIPFVELHGTVDDLTAILKSHPGMVLFAEPDFPTHLIPEVPGSDDGENVSLLQSEGSASWGLDTIGVPNSRNKGAGVHVYVLDTGVRTTHQDFGGRAKSALEVVSSSPRACYGSTTCAMDRNGHGTHCAGTVGGNSYGVAPQASLYGVKVMSDEGTGAASWIVSAIDWVVRNGNRPSVLSMSLGGKGRSSSYQRAIDTATNNGVTVVVAAGNENDDACGYSPAFVANAITVGSTDRYNKRSGFSNYGRCVQIYAPGSSIVSASHQSDYRSATQSGTSMACPHVAGAAALLLQSNRNLAPQQVLSTLVSNARSNVISGLTYNDPNKLLYVR